MISGLCLWLSFPTADLWPLAFVGVAGLAFATAGVSLRAGLGLGAVTGAACFAPVLHWSGIYVGPVPWIALSGLEALYVAGLGAGLALVQRGGRVRPWAVAALWVLQELLRGTVPFGGFPWARLAFSQADSPLANLASIAGAPGVTFAVALVGAWLAVLAQRLLNREWTSWTLPARPVVGAAVLLIAGVLWPVPTAGKLLNVTGIQGNVAEPGLDFNSERKAVLNNHVTLTQEVAASVRRGETPKPDLVVWPENASDIDPLRNADAATEITRAVADVGVPVIVGTVLQEPSPKVSNTSLLYLPGSGVADRYVKQHPVPFAEYIPYRSFFRKFSDKVDLVTADFDSGDRPAVFKVPTRTNGTVGVGPVICFEVAYDSLTREPVNGGAQLLAVQTNNATFGYTAESEQQLAISRIRAIEHGRSIVHISTVGVSAMITPDGKLHDTSGLFTRKALSAALPLRTERTLADRWGRVPEVIVCSIAALLLVQGLRRRRTDKVLARATGSPSAGGSATNDAPTDSPDEPSDSGHDSQKDLHDHV